MASPGGTGGGGGTSAELVRWMTGMPLCVILAPVGPTRAAIGVSPRFARAVPPRVGLPTAAMQDHAGSVPGIGPN